MLNVTRFSHPKIMVPAIHILVDVPRNAALRIQGTRAHRRNDRTQTLPAGDYAIAEAPELFSASNAGA
jgi:hypothetical protein